MFAIVSMATSARSLIALCAISALLEVSTLSNDELCLNFVDKSRCEYYTKSSDILHEDFIDPNEPNISVVDKVPISVITTSMLGNSQPQINKKRLDTKKNVPEYEEMKPKSQKKNVLPRRKRSASEFEKFINRVKNIIIPKYLSNKVKPVFYKKNTKEKIHHGPTARTSNQRHAVTTIIRTKYPKH